MTIFLFILSSFEVYNYLKCFCWNETLERICVLNLYSSKHTESSTIIFNDSCAKVRWILCSSKGWFMQCSSGRLLFWSLKRFLEYLTFTENLHPINFIFKSLSWTAARVCLVCVTVNEGFWKGMFSCYISSLLFKTPLYLLKLFLVLKHL